MSFDLFIFERRESLRTSLDVCAYMEEFTEYEEDRDYGSPEGCSDTIIKWANKMFERFPPMDGEHALSDEIAFASEESEAHLTDYSFGENGVYCAFRWSVSEEALEYACSLVEELNVGVLNFQSSKGVYAPGIEVLRYRTEGEDEKMAYWQEIEKTIETIDSPKRGTSNRDNAFVVAWFSDDRVPEGREEYIQCTPNYPKKSLFGFKKQEGIESYLFEVAKEGILYQTQVLSKKDLLELFRKWCIDREEIDISSYEKIMEL
ncbi:MAG: hypothetical protein Q3993_01830 [Filifactor alocis]|nr:hypothetical protein [Filifactor alocis]